MRIGIDCDGVLRDFIGAFRKVVAQEYPNQEIPWMVTSWRFEKDLPWLTGADIKELYREKFADIVFRDALPIDSRIMEFITRREVLYLRLKIGLICFIAISPSHNTIFSCISKILPWRRIFP